MDFKFRNRHIRLNTLDASKVETVVYDISKRKEPQLKKYLNNIQISNYLKHITQSIKTEANEQIYKSNIEMLMEQYETNIKPIIALQLKEELTEELKDKVINDLKTELKDKVINDLKTELKDKVINDLKTELIANNSNSSNSNNNSNSNGNINKQIVGKMLAHKLMNSPK